MRQTSLRSGPSAGGAVRAARRVKDLFRICQSSGIDRDKEISKGIEVTTWVPSDKRTEPTLETFG